MVIVYDKKSIFEGVDFFFVFFTRTDPHVLYFWKALGTRNSMAMLWGVRHANTQRQRQRQRQIHLVSEVENHYRPYMCYIFGKPWVQGTQ